MAAAHDNIEPLPAPEIRHLCGDLLDWMVTAIATTGALLDEVQAATIWASGGDDLMGEERRRRSGATAAVYDLLVRTEDFPEVTGSPNP